MKIILGFLVFLIGVVAYVPNATTTPQNSDGTQFVISAIQNTVVHQPGYPLYSILNQTIAKLDPLNAFQNIARTSAVFQSLAAMCLFFIGTLFTNQLLLVFLGVVSWLFFEPVARTATDVEVFALHNLIISLVIFFSLRLFLNSEKVAINTLLLGVSWALGVAHHHTIILWLPLSTLALLSTGSADGFKNWQLKHFLKYFVIFLLPVVLGFSLYLTLMCKNIISSYPLSPPNNISELVKFFLRADFGTFNIGGGDVNATNYFVYFVKMSLMQMPFIILSTVVAIFKILKNKNTLNLSLLFCLLLNLLFATAIAFPGEIEVVEEWVTRFFGLIAVSSLIFYFVLLQHYKKIKTLFANIILIFVISPLIFSVPNSLNLSKASDDKVIMKELEAITEELPLNSVFVTSSDRIAMGLSYFQTVLKKRSDLLVVTPSLLNKKEYLRNLTILIGSSCGAHCNIMDLLSTANRNGRFIGAYRELTPPDNFIAIPVGVVWQWVTPDFAISDLEIVNRLKAFCKRFPSDFDKLPIERKHSKLIIDRVYLGPFLSFREYLHYKKDINTASIISEIINNVKNLGFKGAAIKCETL